MISLSKEVLSKINAPSGKFAKLNKNCSISEYHDACADSGYHINNVMVEEVVVLTPSEYNVWKENLMDDCDFLAGKGGNDSHYKSKYDTETEEGYFGLLNDKEEMAKWLAESYSLVVAVTDGYRVVFADPQGYNYARYIGFPVV